MQKSRMAASSLRVMQVQEFAAGDRGFGQLFVHMEEL